MKYVQLNIDDKLKLLKLPLDTKMKKGEINKSVKQLFLNNKIKTLKHFSNFNELYDYINSTPYNILLNYINENYEGKTKYDYTNFIKKIQDYTGKLDKSIMEFILKNYTLSSGIKVLNVIVNVFKNNQELYDFFYKERDNLYKKIKNEDKEKVFDGKSIEDFKKSLETFIDTEHKIVFSLMINHPSLRISDYHTLNIGGIGNNYITKDFKQIVFNTIVKTKIIEPIIINLTNEEQDLFKKILDYRLKKDNYNEKLFDDISPSSYSQQMNKFSKSHFGILAKDFRRLHYLELKEPLDKFNKISKNQGHTKRAATMYYV